MNRSPLGIDGLTDKGMYVMLGSFVPEEVSNRMEEAWELRHDVLGGRLQT